LQVYYQPQFSAASGRLVGVEALVRWPHSDPAWPLPAEFIELAEQGGLIDRLNRWVLEIVFDQLAAWQEAGVTTTISTNLSAINLQDPELFTYIAHGLAARGLNAARLSLEITETAVASDTKAARAVVKRLSEFGVRLSIDDFGTGYSSLIILRELPVEEIKIDRSFVINMTRDSNDAILVRSTIDLAHKLGRAVTAEGVESREALELLKSWGCDVMQGFFLSPPLAIEDLNRKLADATWHSLTSAPAN
jgi:EAL domain-containing protein (putative c-di-GMP-specific phosphodiesterase class I)